MKTFFLTLGVSLLGIVGAYILSLMVTATGFPPITATIFLSGIIIGLLSIVIKKLNELATSIKKNQTLRNRSFKE